MKDPRARLTAAQALCMSLLEFFCFSELYIKIQVRNDGMFCSFLLYLGQRLKNLMFLPAHPWVREGGDASEIPLDISVLHNMRQFVTYSRMKQFALRVKSFSSFGTCMIDVQIVYVRKFIKRRCYNAPGIG